MRVEEVSGANSAFMREPGEDEPDPDQELTETGHCVEENSKSVDGCRSIVTCRLPNRIGEERNCRLNDRHEEEGFEAKMVPLADINIAF